MMKPISMLTALMLLCTMLFACSSPAPAASTTTPNSQASSTTDNPSKSDSVRYAMAGHFPCSITENRYNDQGQLISVIALSASNLAPDYVNLEYVVNKEFIYQNGVIAEMYWNRTHIPLTYDAAKRTATGTASLNDYETIVAEISFNAQNMLVKEVYTLNGETLISYEYDDNGILLKELRPETGFEMNLVYSDTGFTYTILRPNDDNKVQLRAEVVIDQNGLIQSIKQTAGEQINIAYYTYDTNRNCIEVKIIDTQEMICISTYDEVGKILSTRVSSNGDGYESEGEYQYTYNESGKIATFTISSKYTLLTDPAKPYFEHTVTTYTYTYGADGRMSKIQKVKNTLDADGKVTNTVTGEY